MIDVLFADTSDGGDIFYDENSNLKITNGLDTAIYLCLFGGNLDDDGSTASDKLQWWGNDGEPDDRRFRSRFHGLLMGQPFSSALRLRLEEAAKYDIKAGIPYVSSVDVDISMSVKRLDAEIRVYLRDGSEEYVELGVDL